MAFRSWPHHQVDQVDNQEVGSVPADPEGFDHWCVLPSHGRYNNPPFVTKEALRFMKAMSAI